MKSRLIAIAGAFVISVAAMTSTSSFAADPIVGDWMTKLRTLAAISKCGGSYCIRMKSGPFAGKPIGKMQGAGGKYTGSITDPVNNRTYSGRAEIKGGKLHLTGCRAKVFCRTQKWVKR